MAKRETKIDLGFDKAFQGLQDGAKKALTPMEALLAVAQRFSNELDEITKKAKNIPANASGSSGGKIDVAGIKASNDANKLALQLAKEREIAEKALAKAKEAIIKREQEEIKAYEKFQQELKRKAQLEEKAQKQAEAAAKKREEQYNKEIAQVEKMSRPYDQVVAKVKEFENNAKQLGAQLLQLRSEGKEGTKDYSELADQFHQNSMEAGRLRDDLRGIDSASRGATERTKTLKQQLREMTNQLQLLEPGTEEFNNLATAAGALRDQIQDTNAVINATAGSSVENLASGLTGVANIGISAFQGLTSAQALFGVESEELEATLVKLNALAGLSDALKSLGGLRDQLTEIRAAFGAATQSSQLFNRANVAQAVATGQATTAQKILNTVMNANPILLVVGAVTALVGAYVLYQSTVDENIDKQEALNETLDEYKAGATEAVNKTNEVKLAFDLARQGTISKEEALQTYNDTLGDTFGRASDLNEAERLYNEKTEAFQIATAKRARAQALLALAAEESVKGITASLEDQTDFWDKTMIGFSVITGNAEKEYDKRQKEAVKKLQINSEKRSQQLYKLAFDDLKSAEETENANGIRSESEIKLDNDRKKREEDYRKRAEQAEKERREREQKAAEDYNKYADRIEADRIASIKDAQERELQEIANKYDELIALAENAGQSTTEITEKYEKRQQEIRDKYAQEAGDKKASLLKSNEILQEEANMQEELNLADSEAEKEKIRKIYQDRINQIRIEQLELQRDIELKNTSLTEEERQAIILKTEIEIGKIREGSIQETIEQEKTAAEKRKELIQEVKDFTEESVNGALDEYKKQSDAEIARIDERITNEKALQQQLIESANAGNLAAQQSIAASRDAERKATIEKQKEQRKQQILEDIKTFYNLLNNNLDEKKPDGTPKYNGVTASAKALAEIGVIKGLSKALSAIPGFFKGTDRKLGDEMKPTRAGKDGHLIWADANEMILNPTKTSKLEKSGIGTTDDVVNYALIGKNMNTASVGINMMHQNMRFEGAIQTNYVDLAPMLNKMDKLEKAIKSMPTSRIDPYVVNGIARGVVQSEKENGLEKHNIFIA